MLVWLRSFKFEGSKSETFLQICVHLPKMWIPLNLTKFSVNCISANSFCGNYLFFFELLKPWKSHIVSALSFLVCNENLNSFLTRCGNYSRVETIQGRKLFAKIRYIEIVNVCHFLCHRDHKNLWEFWIQDLELAKPCSEQLSSLQ